MTVIEASSVGIKTMPDGTLRLTVDVEPRNAQAAFRLFGAPGVAIALAALVPEHQKPAKDEPKGGAAAQWLGMRCQEPQFQRWLADGWPESWAIAGQHEEDPAEVAAKVVRSICGVNSRAKIDAQPAAVALFNSQIRTPWANRTTDRRTA